VSQFNQQFQDNVDRGVFRQLSSEEARAYGGPVNYISMVEAFKAGLDGTTPLKICMNSSMKQPSPLGVSLNNCLLKKPLALADLYTVMLGMKEHRLPLRRTYPSSTSIWRRIKLLSMSGEFYGGSLMTAWALLSSLPCVSTMEIGPPDA
jgi:hypothetical protein